MKNETRVLILFIIALMCLVFVLFSCNKEEIDPEPSNVDRCHLLFHADRDERETMYAQTYSANRPDTHLEVWAANAQDGKYPRPGMFLKVTTNELDSGTHWGTRWREIYKLKANQDYKYVWLQLRTVNPCGESEFETVLVRIGFGLQEL